ncbi:RNA degradosome polyphosphate kinase [Jeotgalibacillus sp. ET6]|uniref:RNA degradosome polyphosphate kinase n=1 Tax=Jeotgalibacillus sp. ET6 TaxID=3037260 RepID=UPI00241878A3|nr:RNA degradosome polyphosphate kinase [Jeotgalibacillus sp. ET6]MDG5470108.1 RNA degradosome polyphosphate kinase [Jeotgalibacillus sp. ET6]
MKEQNQFFESTSFYNNRELSWLAFNERVLWESMDHKNPLLEQLRFLAIFSSNLDEFFMVRVAGLKDQVKANYNKPENKAGLTPKEQLKEISQYNHYLVDLQIKAFIDEISPELEKEDLFFLKPYQLTDHQLEYIEYFFEEHIVQKLTSMVIGKNSIFPKLPNKSLSLLVYLNEHTEASGKTQEMAVIQMPASLNRIIRVPSDEGETFVMLEDVISRFIYNLFPGYTVSSTTAFRITRNADLTIHEDESSDLLIEIEKELKNRKWGAAVRLEIEEHALNQEALSYLIDALEIEEEDVYRINCFLDLTFLSAFIKEVENEKEHLLFPPFEPHIPEILKSDVNLFELVSKQDLFFHHPYDSFHPIVDFVGIAAEDPDVIEIKQTLYRVSKNSPVIANLKKAARNGIRVTVLVELKARFDEEKNIKWAKELERAGCTVIYGMNYLKTHSKITLVVKKVQDHLEHYVHLGTGNYNEETARIYTDMGILTAHPKVGQDAEKFFNFISGDSDKPVYDHLVVAPFSIRDKMSELIDEEIAYHEKWKNGHIIAKMNSLTDKELIKKFYKASCKGVKIDLIVRGICCLKPGIEGVSENIKVLSIIGRYLEHSRIYYFNQNNHPKIYLSSADLMTRNMEKRVEIFFPILDKENKMKLLEILNWQLRDNIKARYQDHTGKYSYILKKQDKSVQSQQIFLEKANKEE